MEKYTYPKVYISEYCNSADPFKPSTTFDYPPADVAAALKAEQNFKIGDRVRVKEITDPARPDSYRKLSNEFGVVDYIYDIGARVHFPQFMDHFILPFKSLKKEFAPGDKVLNWDGVDCTVDSRDPGTDVYRLTRYDGIECACLGCDQLKYVSLKFTTDPDFGKTHEEVYRIKERDKNTYSNMNMDNFALNQPVHMDKQSENRLNRETKKVEPRFITNGDDLTPVTGFGPLKKTIKEVLGDSLDKKGNTDIMKGLMGVGKRSTAMNTVFENIYGVQTTYAATIVLANGETVNIPDPDEKCWELKRTTKFDEIFPCSIDMEDNRLCIGCFGDEFFAELQDEQARCWAKDMARIVNEEVDQGPFEKYFSYVAEIREYIRKPPQKEEEYPCCYSTLRTLW